MSLLPQALGPTALPPEAEALRAEVRAFTREALAHLHAPVRARSWGGWDPAFSRAAAARGYLGLTLPPAYGGGGRDAFARYVVVEEFLNAGAPVAAHWIAERQSAPQILRFGSPAQKQRHLSAICRGEQYFCIGMSEPDAGSDLASVRTRATPRADGGWLLQGQKIWTTHAHHCHFMIALVRSSGSAEDRQRGLSQFIVDLSLPGIRIRPITDLTGDAHFCEVFFDQVRLPADALLGQEGEGWAQVNSELAFERSGPERLFSSIVLFDEWLAWLRSDAARALPTRRASLTLAGRVLAQIAPLRALSIALTAKLARGESPLLEAALLKDLGTTLEQEIPTRIAEDLLACPSEAAPRQLLQTLHDTLQVSPTFSLRGGTREILRGMIARGLDLR